MVTIKEAKTRKELKAFAKFPIELYKDNPYYVPSFLDDDINILNPKKNLSMGDSDVKAFLAYKDDKLVGRVAAIIVNESNRKFGTKRIRFSRFDFIDDKEVSKALLDAVIAYGKEKGMDTIEGPWGFNDTDREGMLTSGFDEYSTYATAYCYPYYHEHMEAFGYDKQSEWLEHRFFLKEVDERFIRIGEMIQKKNRYFNVLEEMPIKKVIKKYGDSFFECYNAAYSHLDNYIPLTGKLKQATLNQFAVIINPKFAEIIVDKKTDQVVAFQITMPYIGDVLRKAKGSALKAAIPLLHTIKHPKKLELTLFAVHPKYQNSGVHALVFLDFYKHYLSENIEDTVVDPILTTNLPMLNTWKHVRKEVRATRQTYVKPI